MSRSLEPTLLSLLPTLPSASSLPQPLVELASSLLGQSRHNASTLKAEEEVARLYACAHIACERLKTTLDLPPIHVRPPVNPRIYKRLYTHLDHILPASSSAKSGRIRTPSGKASEARGMLGSGNGQRVRERATPSKDAALAQFRSKGDVTPSKSTVKTITLSANRKDTIHDSLPPWVRPAIQSLCTQLDNQRIGRTVLAGMQTIVVPQGRRTKDEWVKSHTTPLLAAVYFLVASRVTILESGKHFSAAQYASLRRELLQALSQARKDVDVRGLEIQNFWESWSDIGTKDIDEALKTITENGWQEGEWFTGIQDLISTTRGLTSEDVEMDDADDHDTVGDKMHMRRGDTMVQGRWVMSDRKREVYRIWKEGILKKVDEIEMVGRGAMEIDNPV